LVSDIVLEMLQTSKTWTGDTNPRLVCTFWIFDGPPCVPCWFGGITTWTKRSWVLLPVVHYQVTTLGELFIPVCLCYQTVQYQGSLALCNSQNRTGVTPVMHNVLSTYRLSGLESSAVQIFEISNQIE